MKDNKVNLLQKIVVIVPEFQQWTGTRAMREIDFALGTNGRLPPKEVAKSLGLKAIIDPETLRVFDKLNSQLYAATKVLRLQNRTREARENETAIENLFLAFGKELNDTMSQVRETLKDRLGQDVPALSYDHTQTIQAKASSSFSRKQ